VLRLTVERRVAASTPGHHTGRRDRVTGTHRFKTGGTALFVWRLHAGLAIEVQGSEGSADEYRRNVVDTFYF
jgi:hypothetical protein